MLQLKTTFRHAFGEMSMSLMTYLQNPTVALIGKSWDRGVGLYRPKKMWNASLSYRTYQSLKKQGIVE